MRYFFNYRDAGRFHSDTEGTELADISAAMEEAEQSARELLGINGSEIDPQFTDGSYEVRDERGVLVGTVAFNRLPA